MTILQDSPENLYESPLTSPPRFWLCLPFWVAMAAGPACWFVIYLLLQPELQLAWPLGEPWQFLLPVVFYPVIEEIVFRGLIQELVFKYVDSGSFGPVSMANLMTSVLFTALHFIHHAPLWAALVFFPSLVFGHFKDSTQGLAAPIMLHVFYNAGFIWLFVVPS